MKKLTKVLAYSAAVIASVLVTTGCATSYPFGTLYTGVDLPVAVGNSELQWSRKGTASCYSILGLIANGDGMKDVRICNGDIVFVKKADAVANGEIAAVVINDKATLKRVYYYPESAKMMLLPENSNYEPLVFVGKELEQIRIIGRAIAFKSEVK